MQMKRTLMVLAGMAVAIAAQELKPFSSDGCSLFPDGTLSQNRLWLNCCITHDRTYWIGGTEAERLKADQELEACVESIGEPEIAKVMLAGVRVGGSPYLPTSFRWGYGWSESRGYKALDAHEKALVLAEQARVAKILAQHTTLLDDVERFRNTRNALHEILEYVKAHHDIFPAHKLHEKRPTSQEERMVIWQTWQAFLDRMMVLDALQQCYVTQQKDADTPFESIGYAAFLAQYRYAMDFIALMENDPAMHTVLNEAVPELGLKKGRYSALKFRFLNVIKGADFALKDVKYKMDTVDSMLLSEIEEDRKRIWEQGRGTGPKATLKNGATIVKDSAFSLFFPLQKEVSEWMGDVKVLRTQSSLISSEQIEQMHTLLQPGDILLERREWYLSNIGLPGYWPHAALYIGTPQERRAFFGKSLSGEKRYGGDFERYLQTRYDNAYRLGTLKHHDGHLPRVIEAISEGVSFTTLQHSVDADSVAILRPRLPKPQIAEAIERAYHYSGRPYDFNFDFLTDSKLVCTELVYKAYEPKTGHQGITFPLQEVVGRKVTTANDMAQLFDAQYGTQTQQLDLIAFYDGHEWQKKALRSDLDAFRESWKRPKWFIWVQK